VRDTLSGESKGFGFVEVKDEEEMRVAQQAVHQCILDGKVLSVEYAKIPGGPQPGPPGALGPGGQSQSRTMHAHSTDPASFYPALLCSSLPLSVPSSSFLFSFSV
jgi:RNA recognition motif-containing protein